MLDSNIIAAFGLTLFAGLSTGIGSALAFFTKKTNTKVLSISLGFSAGVMLYVSFMEIVPKAREALAAELGDVRGQFYTVVAFFAGILFIALLDRFIPSHKNPHEIQRVETLEEGPPDNQKQQLYRMGLFTALAIAIHNFPEGLATFASALEDIKLGIPIAVAIAIHNIPEGIAVSVPIFYSTNSRKKAFIYSFLSGLAEPLGAIIGYALLFSFFSKTLFGVLFAAVAGIMVFISLDELLPAAEEYGEHHLSIYGLVTGMILMAISLLLFL